MNGFHRRSHDLADMGSLRIAFFQHNAKHQIAFAEYSNQPVSIRDANSADAFLSHRPNGFVNCSFRSNRYQWGSCDSQETHKTLRICFLSVNSSANACRMHPESPTSCGNHLLPEFGDNKG